MIQIVVVNAFGFGEEVASWILLMPGYASAFTLKGFLDDRSLDSQDTRILSSPLEYEIQPEDRFVIALSNPDQKRKIAGQLKDKGARFFNVIHPENVISTSFVSGEGLIIAPYNSISNRVSVGNFVSIYGFCKIGHDIRIGDFCHISSHCSIDGFSEVPEGENMASFTKILKKQ